MKSDWQRISRGGGQSYFLQGEIRALYSTKRCTIAGSGLKCPKSKCTLYRVSPDFDLPITTNE